MALEGSRPATADDVATLADLAADAVAELTPTRGGSIWSAREGRPLPPHDEFGAAIDDVAQALVVGTFDGVVLGYGLGGVEDLRDGRRLGVVRGFYVDPEARAVGVGEAMINMLLDWFRGEDCCGVDALALPGNRHTKNFFETFGFTARAIVVHRSLEG